MNFTATTPYLSAEMVLNAASELAINTSFLRCNSTAAQDASLLPDATLPYGDDGSRFFSEDCMNNTDDYFYSQNDTSFSNDTIIRSGTRNCTFDPRTVSLLQFEYPYRRDTWMDISSAEAVKICMYVFVFLVAVAGNLLVILVVFCNANLWSSTNRYLVNLAVADLLVAMCCTWVHLVRHLSSPHYVLPAFVCRLDSFLQATALSASVLTLTAISVGRFVAVMFPLRAHTSPDRACRVILLIWLASALLASPSLLYRQLYSIQWKDMRVWHCDEFWPVEGYFDVEKMSCIVTSDPKKLFYTFFIIAIYFMPVTVMVASYSLVVWRLWASQLPGEHCAESRLTVSRSKKKVVKMVTVVVVVFVICWTPLQSLILYTNVNKDVQLPEWFGTVEYVSYFIAHANSAINPIIYCSFNSSLRRGLLALLTCRHSRRSSLYHRRMKWRGMTAGTRETTFGASAIEPGALTHSNPSLRKGNARVVLRSGNINGSVRSTNHHGTPQELLLVHNDHRVPIEVTVADTPRHRRKVLERNSSAFSVDSSASSMAGCGCCSGSCHKPKRGRKFTPTHRHSNDDIPDIVKIQTVDFSVTDVPLKTRPTENTVKLNDIEMSHDGKGRSINTDPDRPDEITPFDYKIITNNGNTVTKIHHGSLNDVRGEENAEQLLK